MDALQIARRAQEASKVTAAAATERKDHAVRAMAGRLASNKERILAANERDISEARKKNLRDSLVDRLRLTAGKIEARMRALEKIAALPDPVGRCFRGKSLPNGLRVSRTRVPLGVILMIYEARPHVTVNSGALCLKSGNAAILRGGSEARRCNELLGGLWRQSLEQAGLPGDSIQVISGSHQQVRDLLSQDGLIDLVIPRGGEGLVRAVSKDSKIPVIKHYSGVCHVYLDVIADIEKGIEIALDSKCLMPEVCNAMETLLVSTGLSGRLQAVVEAFERCGVRVKGCERTRSVVGRVEPASEADWRTEYLDNIVSVKMVNDVREAAEHINLYGSHHTDSIVTEDRENAREFTRRVDSAVVLVNASTMFCDGESLGMGAEIGISTDKIHARGPMGLEELTSYKLVIHGSGHVMGEPPAFRPASETV